MAEAGSLSAAARKQAAPGARRSASMGSQALQSSMALRDPQLLNGVPEPQVRGRSMRSAPGVYRPTTWRWALSSRSPSLLHRSFGDCDLLIGLRW